MDDVKFVFADNPIIVSSDVVPTEGDALHGQPISVVCGDAVFNGTYTPPLLMDIADIAAAMVKPLAVPKEPNVGVTNPGQWRGAVVKVEGADELEARMVTVTAGDESWRFCVLPGGVSKQNLRFYNRLGTDAFEDRFCNYSGNFFLTTRAEGWKLVIPETELSPLYFVCAVDGMEIIIRELLTGSEVSQQLDEVGIYALDLDRLRRYFVATGILPNVFDIFVTPNDGDEAFAARIAIAHVDAARESHPVSYRSSVGVMEVVDLRGDIEYDSEDVEAKDYKAYVPEICGFVSRRDRATSHAVARINTGARHISSVRLLRDMLASDEVYLGGVRVLPSADESVCRGDVPNDFTVTFKAADDDGLFTPSVAALGGTVRGRVHEDTFEETFN